MPSSPKSGHPKTPPKPRTDSGSAGKAADPRQERLAQALRDNLKKRKAQQRQRRQDGDARDADDRDGDDRRGESSREE